MSSTPLVDSLAQAASASAPAGRRSAQLLLPPLLLAGLVLLASQVSYLLGHVLVELFSVVIAVTALVVASTSHQFTRNHYLVFVATAIGWCALLDLLHTLAFKGMGLFPVDSADPPTQLWVAARLLQALALLVAPAFLRRSLAPARLHFALGAAALLLALLVAAGWFPSAYQEGVGLTPFKIWAEYLIIALLGLALLRLWRARALLAPALFHCMAAALLAMMASEFAFTRYVSVYAGANLGGHLLKILAYWFVYVALVQNTLREPFAMLARAASTYDAVPDPTLVVGADGRILQANRAAAERCGVAAEQLVGRDSHGLFHDARIDRGDCPVCARLAGSSAWREELPLAQGAAVECSLAPYGAAGGAHAWVQVVRDVGERRRLASEREALVLDLGERVKELRCLHAISELSERADVDIPVLLAGVAAALPAAFLHPGQARAAVSSDWGDFGSPFATPPACRLERPLKAGGRTVGRVTLAYPEHAGADDPFLAEERSLMDSVALRVSETIERTLAAAKIRRLSYLYEMLSATNRAVVRCRSTEELLQALFQALVTHGTYPMLFVACRAGEDGPLQVLHRHGLDTQHLPLLLQVLADLPAALGEQLEALQQGRVVYLRVPEQVAADSWPGFLHEAGYCERAVLPLRRDGRLFGVVGLYTRDPSAFDEDELRLLDEMAEDMSFALERLLGEQRRHAAEEQARQLERRFSEVFESSPLPMQIYSVSSGRLLALNHAHRQWLGYQAGEIATLEDWYRRVYPEPAERARLAEHWTRALEQARHSGEPVHSPELSLRCRDGSLRTARGTMTLLGDDAVIGWVDLTDIRRGEQALRESEQRFRGMIEQTLTGIYVRREDAFVYVNPRFCEIAGWPEAALLGRDLRDFVPDEGGAHARIAASWETLRRGEHATSLNVPFRRQDGSTIELGLHATPIAWDGQPAVIAMAQDVTERHRAEQQIANYVKQLEGAMKSTLRAVSNMVDLRDPYTAGHERRVGLIAGDIARELGWPAQRCEALEMIGLVHDIGKIAIPAEILSKPTRLSPLEMELVRGHAQAGYEILKDVEFAAPVAEVIRQHHERLDGSGYPRGLQGEQILPEARVLAVADVLESMAAHRPYRPALGLEAALAELRRGRGQHFDPAAVDAACRLVEEKGYALPH